MKTIKSLLVGAAFALGSVAAMPASAQVTVGNLDGGNCYPFECNDSGTNVGQSFDYFEIYNASAFGPGAVKFDTIGFQGWTPSPGTVLNGNYNISFSTTTAAVGSAYPVGLLANTQSFFNGALGGQSGDFSISGSTYVYNPAAGNLVMEVVVTNQDVVPNGSGNGYLWADYTGANASRAYLLNNVGAFNGVGADVTSFNTTPAVPEPATWAMLILGFFGIGWAARHRASSVTA